MEFREIPPVENEGARLVLITYVDGEGKSGQACAAQYAEENRIAVDCIISPGTFRSSFLETNVKAVLSLDPALQTVALLHDDDLSSQGQDREGEAATRGNSSQP